VTKQCRCEPPVTDSLQAFWPGLQVLYGDVSLGVDGALALSAVWSELGFLPEGLDITTRKPIAGRTNFPVHRFSLGNVRCLFRRHQNGINSCVPSWPNPYSTPMRHPEILAC
jgi:hypothetical protein